MVFHQSEAEKKLEEMKTFREKMKEIAAETRAKEELHKQLVRRFFISLYFLNYFFI